MAEQIYGCLAMFETPNQLLEAARRAHAQGYRKMDAYTPFPVEGLPAALGRRRTMVPLIVLIGGITGGLGGYLMQWFAMARDYPINIGGRPLHSWPSFIPITFELTVLSAALCALLAMLAINGLPHPYHPVFNVPEFARASTDRFFLCLEAHDPKFNPEAARDFFQEVHAGKVWEVTK
jgi:hypothetical protein